MTMLMSFPALQSVTDTAAEAIVDAIKSAVARSALEKSKSENPKDSVVQTKITRTEVLWYLRTVLPRNRMSKVDQDKLVIKVFDALPEQRTVRFKDGTFVTKGERILNGKTRIGIMMIAHDEKVKPDDSNEPQV